MACTVIKVGGSLFEWPELGPRLRLWIRTLATKERLLVPGGGTTAQAIRQLDQVHRIGDEAAHWLALRALRVNAWFLHVLLPDSQVVTNASEAEQAWQSDALAILDAHAFALLDDRQPGALPHSWAATSDSIAARAAAVFGATELILLKSVTIPAEMSWADAARQGWLDNVFPNAVADAGFSVRSINFRTG